MKNKSASIMIVLSAAACLLCLTGLGWLLWGQASGDGETPQTAVPAEIPAKTEGLSIVALGDSLTRGTGDSKGKGYVGYLSDWLKEEYPEVTVSNLGIKGYTAPELAEQLKQPEIRRQVGGADYILLTIGGNDLFQGGRALLQLEEGNGDGLGEGFISNLDGILKEIRSLNAEGTIMLMGLYNPFQDFKEGDLASEVVMSWNQEVWDTAAAYSDIIIVPTFDLFQQYGADYLFSDGFHPNDKGYQAIAKRYLSLMVPEGGLPS
ncbi:GDSL-type esterase/lipase family protein [Paenibacillus sp. CAU 1782]